jgi:hypothetical protein
MICILKFDEVKSKAQHRTGLHAISETVLMEKAIPAHRRDVEATFHSVQSSQNLFFQGSCGSKDLDLKGLLYGSIPFLSN